MGFKMSKCHVSLVDGADARVSFGLPSSFGDLHDLTFGTWVKAPFPIGTLAFSGPLWPLEVVHQTGLIFLFPWRNALFMREVSGGT